MEKNGKRIIILEIPQRSEETADVQTKRTAEEKADFINAKDLLLKRKQVLIAYTVKYVGLIRRRNSILISVKLTIFHLSRNLKTTIQIIS